LGKGGEAALLVWARGFAPRMDGAEPRPHTGGGLKKVEFLTSASFAYSVALV